MPRTHAGKSAKAKGPIFLVASGVNLDLLGVREPDVYGIATLPAIEQHLKECFDGLCEASGVEGARLEFFQSNDEAEFILEVCSDKYEGILLNPGAWTHTSIALADRLKGLNVLFVETHLSNLSRREAFRQHSYTAPHSAGQVSGFGTASYQVALYGLLLAWIGRCMEDEKLESIHLTKKR